MHAEVEVFIEVQTNYYAEKHVLVMFLIVNSYYTVQNKLRFLSY